MRAPATSSLVLGIFALAATATPFLVHGKKIVWLCRWLGCRVPSARWQIVAMPVAFVLLVPPGPGPLAGASSGQQELDSQSGAQLSWLVNDTHATWVLDHGAHRLPW